MLIFFYFTNHMKLSMNNHFSNEAHTRTLCPTFFSSSCILFGDSGVREGAEGMERRRRGEGEIERCRKSLRFAKLQLFSGTKSDDVRGGAVGEGAKVSCSLCCCSSLSRRNRRRRRTIKKQCVRMGC